MRFPRVPPVSAVLRSARRRLAGVPLRVWVWLALSLLLVSVASMVPGLLRARQGVAEIWTDNPGLLAAVERFNLAQSRHVVILRWKDDLARALAETGKPPAVVIGSGLRRTLRGLRYRSLDGFLRGGALSRDSFYPALLQAGRSGSAQALLPLSFDLDLVAFRHGAVSPPDQAGLDPDAIAELAAAWNAGKSDAMAFSYRWNPDTLLTLADALGAGFRDSGASARASRAGADVVAVSPLAWDAHGLDAAIGSLRSRGKALNGSAAKEDDFAFRYLVAPTYRHAAEERILFSAQRASDYFLLDPNLRRALDFRWLRTGAGLRAKEDAVYLGLPEGASGGVAADSFVRWLFTPENQRGLLEASDRNRASETAFGIAGGLSSLIEVNAAGFSVRHPDLAARLPDPSQVGIGSPLPFAWKSLKSGVLEGWLAQAARDDSDAGSASLEAAIAAYLGRHPELVF